MTDINEIIGRAAVAGNISYTAEEIGAAVVKALGEAGYEIVKKFRYESVEINQKERRFTPEEIAAAMQSKPEPDRS